MNNKLKILQIASHDTITRGGAVQMLNLASGLASRGHQVICAFHSKDAATSKKIYSYVHDVKNLRCVFFNMHSIFDFFKFKIFLKKEKFDVIHSHRELALGFSYIASLGIKIPVFIFNRGTVYRIKENAFAKIAITSKKLNKIIAVSNSVKDALMNYHHILQEKIAVIYGDVDVERFNPGVKADDLKKELGLGFNANEKVIGMIAALVHKKGHRDFFIACQKVKENFPYLKILIAGKGRCSKFDSLLYELDLKDNVLFLGHRDDVEKVISLLNVCVCASIKGEGLTGTLREALAMQKPVVTTDIAGNSELIIHNQTGLVVPVGDTNKLADAIICILKNPELANRMAMKGYELIHSKFLNKHRVDEVEKLYYSILNE